jgi:murein DD-endopeptidase MepM/ murein hydrolase activator NlpD
MPCRAHFPLPRFIAAVAMVVVFSVSAFPALAADPNGDPRFQRQADDPVAVAKAQRAELQARIAGQEDKLDQLSAAGERLTAALEETADSLATIMVDLGQLRYDVTAAQMQLTDAEARRDDLQQQVESLDWSLNVLGAQADELAADLDARRRELGARLADAYRAGQTGLWEQVISAGSFLDAIVQQQGALALGEHDRELAVSIETDQRLLDEQRLELRHLRYDTEALRQEVADAAVRIAADRDRLQVAEEALAVMERRTLELQAEQDAKYHEVLANKERVARLLREHRAEEADLSKHIGTLLDKERHAGRLPSAFNGTFRWPLIGEISQEYGCTHFALEPPRDDCDHFHGGIDIVAAVNSPVRAPGDGIVIWVGYETTVARKDANYYVMIAHSDHLVSIYGHLQPRSPRTLKMGTKVVEGQVIGWEGNTGNSTGPHLHWGLWLDGEPTNPRFFL